MKSKSFNLKKWAKSRAGQQVFICIGFMIIPLLLLFLFTYFPFAEMIKFSFYKMKYTTPIDRREFVGWDNYLDVFRRNDCFGALKLSLFYMVDAVITQELITVSCLVQQGFIFQQYVGIRKKPGDSAV